MRGTRQSGRLLTCLVLAVGATACGGGDEPAGDAGGATPAPSAASARACDDVQVPGHEAVGLTVTGTSCAVAERVAAEAQGRGRSPYEAEGFACEPSEAGGGDTNYACTGPEGRIAFRYGTA